MGCSSSVTGQFYSAEKACVQHNKVLKARLYIQNSKGQHTPGPVLWVMNPFDVKQSSSEDHCNISLGHKFSPHLMEEILGDLCVILPFRKLHSLRRSLFFFFTQPTVCPNVIMWQYVCISSGPINQKTESSVFALPLETVKKDSHPHSILRWLIYSK